MLGQLKNSICGFPGARASFPEGFRFYPNEKPALRK